MLYCLVHGAERGAWNMAVDEALMESARQGSVSLRVYGWEPGCLSFGRNQTARGRYDGSRAAARGIEIVRRPTGGRSVFHHREITYSVTAPADEWGGLRDAYLRINRALAAGLRRLGVAASVVEPGTGVRTPKPTVRACFRDPLPGEVVADGRKLIGSAQWRYGGAMLQHGSLLLHNDQETVEELRVGGRPDIRVPAAGLSEYLDPLPDRATIVDALAATFATEFGSEVKRRSLTETERVLAEAGIARYRNDAWTWRR